MRAWHINGRLGKNASHECFVNSNYFNLSYLRGNNSQLLVCRVYRLYFATDVGFVYDCDVFSLVLDCTAFDPCAFISTTNDYFELVLNVEIVIASGITLFHL